MMQGMDGYQDTPPFTAGDPGRFQEERYGGSKVLGGGLILGFFAGRVTGKFRGRSQIQVVGQPPMAARLWIRRWRCIRT